ncbi:tRNA(Ile)-lysidine synthase [Desulfosarcina cetonica]|nr:tRNA(Ile)-lysidine synthase [Desulfosarcina cetonica]
MAGHAMVAAGDRILVGVSGGPDSMTLLHLLHRLAPELKVQLGVAHLNHCLRGLAADQDADLVKRTAAVLGLPCHLGRARVLKVQQHLHLSPEEAARRVRYAFFNRLLKDGNYNKLALGHHLDDNAEQVLLALLRGSGPKGLSGIAPVKDRRTIRPLIAVRRQAIEAYVSAMGISCASDASNADLRFMRNRIRHHLLPLLAEAYNPKIHDQLNRLADIMRMEEAWLEALVEESYTAAVQDRQPGRLSLRIAALRQAHPALFRRLVRRAIEALNGNLRRIRFAHIAAVDRLLINGEGPKELHLPGGIRIRRDGARLILQRAIHPRQSIKPTGAVMATDPLEIAFPYPRIVTVADRGIGLRFRILSPASKADWKAVGPQQAFFDVDKLRPPLILRSTWPGDRFHPLGAKGSQKLKKFFIDHHISHTDRMKSLILTDQERIIWLMGQRIDHAVRLTPATHHILAVEFFLLDTR